MLMTDLPFLYAAQVARELRIYPNSVAAKMQKHGFSSAMVGGRAYWRREDVLAVQAREYVNAQIRAAKERAIAQILAGDAA